MWRRVILVLILIIFLGGINSAQAATDLTSEIARLQALVVSLQAKLNQLLNAAIERATVGGEATSLVKLPTVTPVTPITIASPGEPKRSTTTFIDSLVPNAGPVGTVVTIKGRGFATSSPGNTIYASYQVIKGVKSKDGTTLAFTVSAFDNDFAGPKVFTNRPAGRTVTLPLIVAVENNTGISNDLTFNITYPAPIYEPQI